MKDYNVFLCDGTYIEIEAETWYDDDGMIIFIDISEDEVETIKAAFVLDNIAGFCEVNE